MIIVSNEEGKDIEDVAKTNQETIKYFPMDVLKGLTDETVKKVTDFLNVDNETQRKQAVDQVKKLYDLFIKTDSTQIEISPWITDAKVEWYIVDAKINIDDSASFRQGEILHMKENSAASEDTDPNEVKAANIYKN